MKELLSMRDAKSTGFIRYDKRFGWVCEAPDHPVAGTKPISRELCASDLIVSTRTAECPTCHRTYLFPSNRDTETEAIRLERAKTLEVVQSNGDFSVRSASRPFIYLLSWDKRWLKWSCPCEDYQSHRILPTFKCKHVLSVELYQMSQGLSGWSRWHPRKPSKHPFLTN